MKKYMLRFLSFIFALLLVLQIPLASASALEFTAGSNSASASYKSGKYYENLTSLTLTGDGRTDVLAVALSQLGYQEGDAEGSFSGLVAGSSNYTEFNHNFGPLNGGYGGSIYPWCAAFVSFCLLQAKTHSLTKMTDWCRDHKGDEKYIWREISCNHWADQLRICGYFEDSKSNGGSYIPQSGDLIFFADGGVGKSETHIGIVLYSDGEKVYTVEGNTSSADGLEANGGGVYLKSYALDKAYIRGYGVLPYKVNSFAPRLDYSGTNITTGVYAASTNKYVYETEDATEYKWLLERGSMFTVTEICTNGRVKAQCKINGQAVTGYIMNNTDRIVQLSSDKEFITDIKVTSLPEKLTYIVGDSLYTKGLEVTAYYNTGKAEVITDYDISFDTSSVGKKTVTVSKGSLTAEFEAEVQSADTLSKLEVTTLPSKTVYFEGEEFDKAGMVVTATYTDGRTEEVKNYTVSGYSSTEGYKRLSVKYGKKTASFMVTVKANVIEKIEITKLPDKLVYNPYESPSLDGIEVCAVYSDGTKSVIKNVDLIDSEEKIGKSIVTVGYYNFRATYEITYVEKEHSGIRENENTATCTKEGYTGDIVCDVCGEVIEKGSVIPKKDHVTVYFNRREATCTEEGYTGDLICELCYEVLEKGSAIPKTKHSENLINDILPTCTKEGYTGDKVCINCNVLLEKGSVIPMMEHSRHSTNEMEATCSREGYTGDVVCVDCGKVLEKGSVIPKPHHPDTVGCIEATCSKEGYTGDIVCSACNEVIEKGTVIKKKSHSFKTVTVKATLNKNGSVTKKCSSCGELISKETVYRVKTVKLKKDAFVYNGKNPDISVIVMDSKGKKLKKNTDYKVKLASSRKKVGSYKVTVTFTGKYKGEKVLTFEVVPKGTSISKLTGSQKGFSVKWKKQTAQITGYEIQYSTSKKFTKKTTKTLSAKSKSTSKKVQKLKSKKTYYVRIRTYKTVKGKKLYSAWSSVKSVKTK